MVATTEMSGPHACLVCRASDPGPLVVLEGRRYWRCGVCEATFLDACDHPSPETAYAHYLRHENDPADPGYRRFLAKLAVPLLARLAPVSRGLDYGCGPGPALAAILQEAGHEVALYDPFFQPDPAPLKRTYEFITCTETAEHFGQPPAEFDRLDSLLEPGGWLALMTCFQTDDAAFADWHYRRDPTHVVFYREATLHHLAMARGWSCEIPLKDVALMRKPARGKTKPC